MAFFALLGVLGGFPAAAYRRTPPRPATAGCGLDQDNPAKAGLDWTRIVSQKFSGAGIPMDMFGFALILDAQEIGAVGVKNRLTNRQFTVFR